MLETIFMTTAGVGLLMSFELFRGTAKCPGLKRGRECFGHLSENSDL